MTLNSVIYHFGRIKPFIIIIIIITMHRIPYIKYNVKKTMHRSSALNTVHILSFPLRIVNETSPIFSGPHLKKGNCGTLPTSPCFAHSQTDILENMENNDLNIKVRNVNRDNDDNGNLSNHVSRIHPNVKHLCSQ